MTYGYKGRSLPCLVSQSIRNIHLHTNRLISSSMTYLHKKQAVFQQKSAQQGCPLVVTLPKFLSFLFLTFDLNNYSKH